KETNTTSDNDWPNSIGERKGLPRRPGRVQRAAPGTCSRGSRRSQLLAERLPAKVGFEMKSDEKSVIIRDPGATCKLIFRSQLVPRLSKNLHLRVSR
ncbi:hypothetical protein FIBSPDRAFT_854374, partial [Athelia psychrophila]